MNDHRTNLRELTLEELRMVNGGNMPSVFGAIALAWNIGYSTGRAINRFNSSRGTSLGSAIYQFAN